MVGRALWSVRVLLGEDRPDAGSEAVGGHVVDEKTWRPWNPPRQA